MTAEYIATASLVLSLIGFLFTWLRTRISDIKEYENRFTVLEESQIEIKEYENRLTFLEQNTFTDDDRACLRELDIKVGVFWKLVESEAPKLLKRNSTPYLDALLSKAELGLNTLSIIELYELDTLLTEQYNEDLAAGDVESPGRALVNALYRARIKMSVRCA